MNKIRVLSDNLANQIAAGEVVERPASVIKELVENSIDAGASRIKIEIELGGRRLMRISDDGEGMERDDAILCFERHATSKIRELDDLGRIVTLGFRGEALASIASVARVELLTNTDADKPATRVVIEGGRLLDVKDAARPVGTTITVRDLFFNTPARRKFMRSEATENYHITLIATHYALAHPDIAFTLMNNGRETISAAPAKDLKERAFQIFGSSLMESLIPVSGGRDHVARVSGFISAPRERRTNRDSQYFFVNHRFVRDKTIAEGLREGFRSVLPNGVYPVAFLFLDLPPEEIDVNVHPAKTEIRFRRSEAVKDVIGESVRMSLAQAGFLAEDETRPERLDAFMSPTERTSDPPLADGATSFGPGTAFAGSGAPIERTDDVSKDTMGKELTTEEPPSGLFGDALVDIAPASLVFEQIAETRRIFDHEAITVIEEPPPARSARSGNRALPPVDSAERIVSTAEIDEVRYSKIRPIAQLHDSFIIAVDDEGMLLIDQHVAHERILFDKYRKQETDRPIESQNLLLPETVDLTPAQAEAFQLVEADLASLGFGTMRLSGRTIAIKSIPTDLPASEARNLFSEILDTVELESRGSAKSSLRDDIAASLACKAAVKINMSLSPEKMQWLIDRLLVTSSPTTCPHGRPVILRLTMKDIERGFQRT